jgi:hypothetical protein
MKGPCFIAKGIAGTGGDVGKFARDLDTKEDYNIGKREDYAENCYGNESFVGEEVTHSIKSPWVKLKLRKQWAAETRILLMIAYLIDLSSEFIFTPRLDTLQ